MRYIKDKNNLLAINILKYRRGHDRAANFFPFFIINKINEINKNNIFKFSIIKAFNSIKI